MCSRNTVRESSHISFFCGEDPFCEVVGRPENIHGELTGLLEWPAGLCLQSKITDLILSFLVPCGYRNILFAHVFFCLWLVIGTYLLPFFPCDLLILSVCLNVTVLFLLIDRTLSGVATPGQSGTGSNGNEEILCIPQSSSITGASPSDCLMSNLGKSLGREVLHICRNPVGLLYSPIAKCSALFL